MKILSAFFALFFVPFLFRLDVFQTRTDDVILLGKNGWQMVGQTFKAKHDNIYFIKILVNNPQLSYKQPIFFTLKNQPGDDANLAAITFSGENVGTNYWVPLKFNPVTNSKNKNYYFELNTIPSSSSALEVRRFKQDAYNLGEVFIDGKKTSGDLGFKVYYKVGIKQFIVDTFSDFKSRVNSDIQFFSVYIFIVAALVVLIVVYAVILK